MPIDWVRLRAAKETEVASLRGLQISEVTPSRRDFTRFIGSGRGEVGVIAALRRRDPWSGQTWSEVEAATVAAALDETEVAGLAVTTEPLFHAGRLEDLQAATEAVTAPLLRDDPLHHPLQVFQSRMHGADACTIAAAWTDAPTLAEIVRTASSLHMAAVLAVSALEEIEAVLPHERHAVGIWAQNDDGGIDLERVAQISARIPGRRSVILLGDVLETGQWNALRGLVDAAVVARLFMQAKDPGAALSALVDA